MNPLSIKRLIQNPTKNKKIASIVIISHQAKSSSLVKMLTILSKKKYIISKPKFIRVEQI